MPTDALAIARDRQRNLEGWVARKEGRSPARAERKPEPPAASLRDERAETTATTKASTAAAKPAKRPAKRPAKKAASSGKKKSAKKNAKKPVGKNGPTRKKARAR